MRTDYRKAAEEAKAAREAKILANGWELADREPVSATALSLHAECWPDAVQDDDDVGGLPSVCKGTMPGYAPSGYIVNQSLFQQALEQELDKMQAQLHQAVSYGKMLKDSPIGKFYDLDPMSDTKAELRRLGIDPGELGIT